MILSRFVALSVSIIQKVSLLQIDAANADARGRRIVHGAPFGAAASTVRARYERYAGGVAETVYCARWRGAAPFMGGAHLPFKLRAVLWF